MIKHNPENKYVSWDIPDGVTSDEWQRLIRQIPYDELIKFLKSNEAIKYSIIEGTKC